MTNRIIFLGALLVVFALTINIITNDAGPAEPSTPGNDPDFYMLNAAIRQFDDRGILQHRIEAGRFTHFPLTDVIVMKQPSMFLGSDRDAEGWQIDAMEGRILPATMYREEVIELWDEVLAARAEVKGEFINIQTENLTVYPEREYAETDQQVTIDNQTGRTTAAGMKAFFNSGRFMFYSQNHTRVTSVFQPDLRPRRARE